MSNTCSIWVPVFYWELFYVGVRVLVGALVAGRYTPPYPPCPGPRLFCFPVIDYRKHVLLREVIADLMQSDDQLVLYLVAPPPHTGSRYPPRLLKCSGAFYIASCIGWPSLVSVVGHGHGFYLEHARWSGGTLGRLLGVTASHTSCKAY